MRDENIVEFLSCWKWYVRAVSKDVVLDAVLPTRCTVRDQK